MTHEEYLNKVESIPDINSISDSCIEELINDLLTVIPFGGKLYKYRTIESEHYLDNLKYMYLAPVSELNDKIDTTLNYRFNDDEKSIDDFYLKNKDLVYRFFYLNHSKYLEEKKLKVVDCFIQGMNDFETAKTICKDGEINFNDLEYVINIRNDINNVSNKEEVRKAFVEENNKIGERIRNSFRVFSLSETYYQDSMWAYYCRDNRGYVIEYDFNKIKFLDTSEKKRFIYTYKVSYRDERPVFDIQAFYYYIFSGSKDPVFRANLNITFNKQLLTKNKSWRQEQEWRISLNDGTDKIYSDIVSAIIIDESIVNEDRTIEILNYATIHKWKIKIRILNLKTLTFEYNDIKETTYWKTIKKKIKNLH